MSNFMALFIMFVLIYCTLTCFHLAYKLSVMQKALETVLTNIKKSEREENDFQKGVFTGLLTFYTEYFDSKKFLEKLTKDNQKN